MSECTAVLLFSQWFLGYKMNMGLGVLCFSSNGVRFS